MIRYLKTLGLALFALMAMSVVAASAASAQTTDGKLTIDSGTSATLDMTELKTHTNAFTAKIGGGIVECEGSILTGHKTLTTAQTEEKITHQPVPAGASSITVTPHYNNAKCITVVTNEKGEVVETHKTTVTMNGCDYDVTVGETAGNNEYEVTADLVCPANKDVEIEVYTFAGSEFGGVACKITLTAAENQGLTGPTLRNTTTEHENGEKTWDLDLTGTFNNIHSERSGFGCETATSAEDKLDIGVTIEGTNEAGQKVGITVSH